LAAIHIPIAARNERRVNDWFTGAGVLQEAKFNIGRDHRMPAKRQINGHGVCFGARLWCQMIIYHNLGCDTYAGN